MNNRLFKCLVAGALAAALAAASPALARGGGGGGMRGGGGMGGGMHYGGMGGGMHYSGMAGGMHSAGSHFMHDGSRFAFRDHDRFNRRFDRDDFRHHRFRRFAFFGAPYYAYAAYDGCWRRVWTSYGPQWVNVCGNYGY